MSVVFEGCRDDYFPDLMSWAEEHGASCEGFVVTNFGVEGYGLRATRDIKVNSDMGNGHSPLTTQHSSPLTSVFM